MNKTMIEEITKLVLLKLEEHAEELHLNQNGNNKTDYQPAIVNSNPLSEEEIKMWNTISGNLLGGNNRSLSFNEMSVTKALDVEEFRKWEEVTANIRKMSTEHAGNKEEQVKLYPTFY
jgi:hypothetical protein